MQKIIVERFYKDYEGCSYENFQQIKTMKRQRHVINSLLPPASEGWGNLMFSVCSHLGGGGSVQPGVGQSSRRGGGSVQLARGGSVQLAGGGGQSSRGGGGWVSPAGGGGSAKIGLTKWQVVCLLRSRRRTFFSSLSDPKKSLHALPKSKYHLPPITTGNGPIAT